MIDPLFYAIVSAAKEMGPGFPIYYDGMGINGDFIVIMKKHLDPLFEKAKPTKKFSPI